MKQTDTLDISEARKNFSKLDERLKKERVIWVTRHNSRAFAIVDMETMEAVLETLEILQDPTALRMLQESLADIRAGRLHDHDDLEREVYDSDLHSMDDDRKKTPPKPAKARTNRVV
jgi:PHD/YefM family antitoxin component YafN of YafNO toxin-antitoxin module